MTKICHIDKMSQRELLAKYPERLRYPPSIIQSHLADLLPDALVKRVREEFYNPLVFEMAACVLHAIFTTSNSQVPIKERIRHWLRDLEQIGPESAEGYALRADLGPVDDTFILKAQRNPIDSDLIHETFIGLYGTNRLRPLLPNFAYVFGGFDCSTPIIETRFGLKEENFVRRDEIKVISYCEPGVNKEIPYVIYENIAPAIPLSHFVRTCTGEEFFLVFRQLLLALRNAWLTIGFVHNDLHYYNVLIRQLDKTYSFRYSGPQGAEYITTNQLATIIDFGRSSIKYRGRRYGISGLERFAVFEDLSLPINDAYKILFFSLYSMKESRNWSAYHQVKQLVPYFYPKYRLDDPNFDDKLLYLLNQDYSIFFYYLSISSESDREAFHQLAEKLQNNEKIEGDYPEEWIRAIKFDYDDFLLYMSNVCQCSISTNKPIAPLAYCRGMTCGQPLKILNSFFERPLNQPPTAEDFFDFYDLHTDQTVGRAFRKRLTADFKTIYQKSRDDYLMELRTEVDNFSDTVRDINPDLSLTSTSPRDIIGVVMFYRDRFNRIASAASKWKDLLFMVEIGEYVADVYRDEDLRYEIQDLIKGARPYKQDLDDYVGNLFKDRQYIRSLHEREEIPRSYLSDPDIKWLTKVFPEQLDVLLK